MESPHFLKTVLLKLKLRYTFYNYSKHTFDRWIASRFSKGILTKVQPSLSECRKTKLTFGENALSYSITPMLSYFRDFWLSPKTATVPRLHLRMKIRGTIFPGHSLVNPKTTRRATPSWWPRSRPCSRKNLGKYRPALASKPKRTWISSWVSSNWLFRAVRMKMRSLLGERWARNKKLRKGRLWSAWLTGSTGDE